MERYLVFIGYNYYPDGGMNDFHDDYLVFDDAKRAALGIDTESKWSHIYDTEKYEIVYKSYE